MKDLLTTYQERATSFRQTAESLENKYNRLALFRLLLFVSSVGLAIYFWSMHPLAGAAFIFFSLLGFARFVFWHLSIRKSQRFHEALTQVNENEIRAISGDHSMFADGTSFSDPLHPYLIDLDVFGPHSFFQFTNRTSTAIGCRYLAQFLSRPVEMADIDRRQQSITELKEELEWRQRFQAYGMATEDDLQHIESLEEWMSAPSFVENNRLYLFALILNPIWATGVLLLFIFYLPWYAALALMLPTFWIIRKTLEPINQTHVRTAKAGKILAFYADLIRHIEAKDFGAPQLQDLKNVFSTGPVKASKSIDQLSYIISQLNVRYNAFAVILNVIGLWDLYWVRRLELWKKINREALPQWFDSLQQMEALLSLATSWYNHPDWSLPTLVEEGPLEATSLGHPLIAAQERVNNDIHIPTEGHIKLVTGSNMAGKSTFLRTLGLNVVLAGIGAPVCASSLRLPILEVYTSMRTQDALHESTSSFYAELKRLKTIIEAVESRKKVFFLLDEILKGTNSNDRHTGSKALIRQLIRSGGSGIIATHDLELGALEEQYDGAIENLCMEVAIEDSQLRFDYKIRKGVSKSFNATLLMKEMGIKI
ncbi:MAG: hypothetical protein AAFV95_13550 [Bacteroidota bacterium]